MYNGVLVNSSEDSERAAFQRHITVYASIVLGDASASDPVRVLFAIGSRRGRGLGLGVHSPCVYTSEPNFMYPCVVLVLGIWLKQAPPIKPWQPTRPQMHPRK